jgi:hypothetical protein
MYWPIGAPRIYAASNRKAQKGLSLLSDDGIESDRINDRNGSRSNVPGSNSDIVQEDEDFPQTPTTPGVKPVEQDAHQRLAAEAPAALEDNVQDYISQAKEDHIISLKISRSGHLFAVITRTSLTIWQTKVGTTTYHLFSTYTI